jgi:hypothetical protein
MHLGTGCNKQLGPRSVALVVFRYFKGGLKLAIATACRYAKVDSVKSSTGSETFSRA